MKRKFLVIFYILLISLSDDISYSSDDIYPDIVAQVNRVYDGDTIFVNVPNIPEAFGKELGIRIHGIDTPEMKGSCDKEKAKALEAKLFIESLVKSDQFIILRNITRDKYFRLGADIHLSDGRSVSELLLKAGLAYPYDGKVPKRSWCE